MAASGFAGQRWTWQPASQTDDPTCVKAALVHAASVLSTCDRKNDPREVSCVDMRPLVLHLLEGLQRAGLTLAVVAVGENAKQIEAAVKAAGLTILINWVHVPPSLWRNLVSSILLARCAFPTDAPFLIVRADQLYDWRLLRKLASVSFAPGVDAFALIDTAPSTLHWASGAHCSAMCKTGQGCNALVKVQRDANGFATSCGHRLASYDAVIAGDMYASTPKIFAILAKLFKESMYCHTSDAMMELACRGTLGCVDVGELHCHWFGTKTVTALFREHSRREALTRRELARGGSSAGADAAAAAAAAVASSSSSFAAAATAASGGECAPCEADETDQTKPCETDETEVLNEEVLNEEVLNEEVLIPPEEVLIPPTSRERSISSGWKHVVEAARELLTSNDAKPLQRGLMPLFRLGAKLGQGVHASTCACIHMCMHPHVHASTCACIHICMHACIRTCMHTCLFWAFLGRS